MLKLFKRKRKAAYRRWAQSKVLLELNRQDGMCLADFYENTVIIGSPGSGKTSGSGDAICRAFLSLGLGGLVLTAKPGDAHRWKQICRQTGRENDLIIVDDSGNYEFSFLDHTLNLLGHGGAGIENVVATLYATMKVAERVTSASPSNGTEAFWEHGIRRHARAVVGLLIYAVGSISICHILEVLQEFPRSLGQANSEDWRKESIICQLLGIARAKAQSDSARHDIEQIESYCLRSFPAIADRTRSVFEAGLFGILDLLSKGSLFWTFGRGTNVDPGMCLDSKILVINWPTATHGAVGVIAQTLFKLAFQRMVQHRTVNEESRPVFLVMDEFQCHLGDTDYLHLAISRESLCCTVMITQSVASLHAVLGSDASGKASVDALLGLANYKFFHANGDPVTNQWAADAIGRRWMRKRSLSINHEPRRVFDLFPEQPGFSTSSDEITEYAVMPHVFASLLRGGPPKMQTEAILYASGRVFKSTNDTYVKVLFDQGV